MAEAKSQIDQSLQTLAEKIRYFNTLVDADKAMRKLHVDAEKSKQKLNDIFEIKQQCRGVTQSVEQCAEMLQCGVFCSKHVKTIEAPLHTNPSKKLKKNVQCCFSIQCGDKPEELLVIGLFPNKEDGYVPWLKDQLLEKGVFEGFTLMNIFPYVATSREEIPKLHGWDEGDDLLQQNHQLLRDNIAAFPSILFATGSFSKGEGKTKQEFFKSYEKLAVLLNSKAVYCFDVNADGRCSNFGKFHKRNEKVELKQVKFVQDDKENEKPEKVFPSVGETCASMRD